MHLVLARYLNKRLIELHPNTRGETVGVLRRDGTYDYRPWLGFIDRARALQLSESAEAARSVKLQVARVGSQGPLHVDWRDVPKGRHVQGCLTRKGAYAVADWSVKLI
jgi:hypothetical protein